MAAVLGGCGGPARTPLPPAHAPQAVLDSYGVGIRLGESVRAALTRTPTLRARGQPGTADPGPGGQFVARAIGVAESRRARLGHLFGQDAPDPALDSAGTVRSVVLVGDRRHARAAVEHLTALLGAPPAVGCAGLEGVAVDQVFTWSLDGGGVALTIPTFRAAGAPARRAEPPRSDVAPAQVVVLAGAWDTDRIEVGYRTDACPGGDASADRAADAASAR